MTAAFRPGLTVHDIAKRFNISVATAGKHIRDGTIPSYKIGGSRRVRPEVADAIERGEPIPKDVVALDKPHRRVSRQRATAD
ncbi:MAG TPA: helix-turn-helix domain-containing protein [Mycobacterium sp.]|jgi:excisionase family DNA binding protein|nr:helix-turn-helix domain-containing protein [Mycobacterium sp.]